MGDDTISRKATIHAMEGVDWYHINKDGQLTHGANSKDNEPLYKAKDVYKVLNDMPSAQPERVWHPVEKPPAHHKDVIVRGVEAIGNVTVHKVMQWDVDTWRPTDYAPSIMWTEWSEI